MISVPGLLRWFSSSSVASVSYFIQIFGYWDHSRWVTPFGYPGITGYVLLPRAFRSLSRPSSPRSSKASTIHLYSLDHIIVSSLIETLPLTVASASVRFATSRFFGQARRAGISFPRSVVSLRSRFISTLNKRSLRHFHGASRPFRIPSLVLSNIA